ncbi:acyltransferase family protein [Acetanaerobacterium elongatum]|uniref:Surface polysaccharide O-acyltransferase, integral membrane enzyme n=1 Tax=Acetanaerobacterium elongatum TaxID=258515 RepID=A0A1H0EQQ7_9FIRM|nr:acyltransferase family protein [Acetanaerobacterium elongatum]SDN84701.1 Surface polysaccharide O-acyltransferase, integral membrane enzyme [Acetanaerobacterium elongatum]
MRRHYIDNLRSLCILLLFPYHTCMVYNTWESFYVHGQNVEPLADFIIFSSPWFMPLMFVLAGISASLALEKRTAGQFIKERFFKLFIPLLFGIVLVVPAQSYFAERFHNGYTGGYFKQYILFFTTKGAETDFCGGFTVGHLWFLAYLFIISLLALPVMLWYNKRGKQLNASRLTLPWLLPMCLIPLLFKPLLDFSGKSIGEFFTLFMLGFFVLSREEVLKRLEYRRWPLTALGLALLAGEFVFYFLGNSIGWVAYDIMKRIAGWVCILAILGLGRRFLNFTGKAASYFVLASFPVYIYHQTWLVAAAYYALALTNIVPLQVVIIMAASFILSIATYEITRRFSVTRFMFGIKAPKLTLPDSV